MRARPASRSRARAAHSCGGRRANLRAAPGGALAATLASRPSISARNSGSRAVAASRPATSSASRSARGRPAAPWSPSRIFSIQQSCASPVGRAPAPPPARPPPSLARGARPGARGPRRFAASASGAPPAGGPRRPATRPSSAAPIGRGDAASSSASPGDVDALMRPARGVERERLRPRRCGRPRRSPARRPWRRSRADCGPADCRDRRSRDRARRSRAAWIWPSAQ